MEQQQPQPQDIGLLDQIQQLTNEYRADIEELTNSITNDIQSYLSSVTARTEQYATDLRALLSPNPEQNQNIQLSQDRIITNPSQRRTTET